MAQGVFVGKGLHIFSVFCVYLCLLRMNPRSPIVYSSRVLSRVLKKHSNNTKKSLKRKKVTKI